MAKAKLCQHVLALFRDVFNQPHWVLHQDFSSLGLSSMDIIRFCEACDRHFSLHISIVEFYEHRSLEGLLKNKHGELVNEQ